MAAGGVPIIENPVSTLLFAHPRFLYLVALLKDRGISQLATVGDAACFFKQWNAAALVVPIPWPVDLVLWISNSGVCRMKQSKNWCFSQLWLWIPSVLTLAPSVPECILASGMFRQALWMKHFGHTYLKLTLLWSTSKAISLLDLGKIQKGVRKSEVKTAEKYQDKSGKWRYKGTGKVLKNTQLLVRSHKSNFWCLCLTTETPSTESLPATWCFMFAWLRFYPPRFIGNILGKRRVFLAEAPTLPEVPVLLHSVVGCAAITIPRVQLNGTRQSITHHHTKAPTGGPRIFEIVRDMPPGDLWDDAELWAVYEYLRGSKHLQIPMAYRTVLL